MDRLNINTCKKAEFKMNAPTVVTKGKWRKRRTHELQGGEKRLL